MQPRANQTFALACCLAFAACTKSSSVDSDTGTAAARVVEIYAAASLGRTLDALEGPFEAAHPGVDLRIELSGSRIACNKVADQGRPGSAVFSADFELIDELLVPKHADFNLLFARNALVLAYAPKGKAAKALDGGASWQKVASRPDIAVGIANPALAPVGYRALLALRLNDRVAAPELRLGTTIEAQIEASHMRPDVAKLVAPLQAGELDMAFLYRSEALQHGLSFVDLDDRIDFSDVTHQELYRTASYEIPATGTFAPRKVRGRAAVYGLTIPKNAPHADLAVQLVEFLLSDAGRKLAAKGHMELFAAGELKSHGELPAVLATAAEQGAVP